MRFDAARALILYAGCVTAALLWLLIRPPAARMDTIDVQRINVRESDGTLRLAISSRDRFPGLILHGQEHPHPGRTDSAGMIFFNDEGTENGGLIFGGAKQGGKATSFGHLSFDQYDQDQVTALDQTEEGGQRRAGLSIFDRPVADIDLLAMERLRRLPAAEREAALQGLRDDGVFGRKRAFFGKTEDRASVLDLRDAGGKVRLRLSVAPDGAAAIDFLDAAGAVRRRIAASAD